MAKAEKMAVNNRPPAVRIQSKDDADRALWTMGRLRDAIAAAELSYQIEVRELEEKLSSEVAPLKKNLAAYEKALEKWAKNSKVEIFREAKTLELPSGFVGFRWGNWTIRYLVKAATVIERLKEAGLPKLVKIKESVNKRRILDLNYENDKLEPLGMKKVRSEKFFYECKPEVK